MLGHVDRNKSRYLLSLSAFILASAMWMSIDQRAYLRFCFSWISGRIILYLYILYYAVSEDTTILIFVCQHYCLFYSKSFYLFYLQYAQLLAHVFKTYFPLLPNSLFFTARRMLTSSPTEKRVILDDNNYDAWRTHHRRE